MKAYFSFLLLMLVKQSKHQTPDCTKSLINVTPAYADQSIPFVDNWEWGVAVDSWEAFFID
jgi:hypothetical protein